MNKTTQFKGLLHSGHVEFNNFPMRRVYFLPTVLVLMVGMLLIVTPYAEPQDAVIQVIDATTFGSSDPSGLTVLPDLPDSSTLFLSDSEIEETGFFMGVNLFELDVDGSLIFETNTLAFSNEPTGVAFNTSTNTLFITDDDKKKVFEIDLSFPDTVLSSFSTADFGSSDPEGITFDPVTGNLFIIDGRDETIYEVTTAGVLVESITLPSTIIDPEGIYYDYNNNVFFIVSGKNRDIFEVSRGGTIVNTIDVLQTYDVTPKGVTCGPSSDPAAPAGICHLWVADYGRDEVNDGRLFEIELGSNRPPMVDAGPNQTISFGTQATLAGIVIDDGQPSGTLDIQWSQESGPGTVTFVPPTTASTAASFTAPGTYGLRLTGDDGELVNSDAVVVTVTGGGGPPDPVTHVETQTGGSSASNTVSTSTSLTGVSGDLYIAAISTKTNVTVTNVSGLGLSWEPLYVQCSGRNQTGIIVWTALGVPTGDGAVTATLGKTPRNAVIAVSRYSGVNPVNPIGNLISGNTNGIAGACFGGSDTNAYAFDLSTTMQDAVVYGVVALRLKAHTPGQDYVERVEIHQGIRGGAIAGLAVEEGVTSLPSVTVNGTISGNVDWAMVGFEILP